MSARFEFLEIAMYWNGLAERLKLTFYDENQRIIEEVIFAEKTVFIFTWMSVLNFKKLQCNLHLDYYQTTTKLLFYLICFLFKSPFTIFIFNY